MAATFMDGLLNLDSDDFVDNLPISIDGIYCGVLTKDHYASWLHRSPSLTKIAKWHEKIMEQLEFLRPAPDLHDGALAVLLSETILSGPAGGATAGGGQPLGQVSDAERSPRPGPVDNRQNGELARSNPGGKEPERKHVD